MSLEHLTKEINSLLGKDYNPINIRRGYLKKHNIIAFKKLKNLDQLVIHLSALLIKDFYSLIDYRLYQSELYNFIKALIEQNREALTQISISDKPEPISEHQVPWKRVLLLTNILTGLRSSQETLQRILSLYSLPSVTIPEALEPHISIVLVGIIKKAIVPLIAQRADKYLTHGIYNYLSCTPGEESDDFYSFKRSLEAILCQPQLEHLRERLDKLRDRYIRFTDRSHNNLHAYFLLRACVIGFYGINLITRQNLDKQEATLRFLQDPHISLGIVPAIFLGFLLWLDEVYHTDTLSPGEAIFCHAMRDLVNGSCNDFIMILAETRQIGRKEEDGIRSVWKDLMESVVIPLMHTSLQNSLSNRTSQGAEYQYPGRLELFPRAAATTDECRADGNFETDCEAMLRFLLEDDEVHNEATLPALHSSFGQWEAAHSNKRTASLATSSEEAIRSFLLEDEEARNEATLPTLHSGSEQWEAAHSHKRTASLATFSEEAIRRFLLRDDEVHNEATLPALHSSSGQWEAAHSHKRTASLETSSEDAYFTRSIRQRRTEEEDLCRIS